jgi:UDP-GlcNAc:undecaprenyl-phosphate/decaprenyl-phosphate GlcNAc-1-phosphate transferase
MTVQSTYLVNVFLLSVCFILLLERAAPRLGMIDVPSGHKTHDRPVPVIGGIAVFAAFVLVDLMLDAPHRAPWDLLAGLAMLVAAGLIDDRYGMRAVTKLIAQFAAACMLTLPHGAFVTGLGDLFNAGIVPLGALALPFTLVLIVGLANSYNMFDGMDGLAGGASAAALFWLAVLAIASDRGGLATVALLFLFGTLGFLVFNLRHPWCAQARIFLGDAGSMMLGAGIAVLIIRLSRGPGDTAGTVPLPALLWVCALPAIDTVSLAFRRLYAGRSPFAADRNHLHHLLLDAGMPPRRVVELLIALCFALAGFGFAGAALGIPDWVMGFGLLFPLALHTAFVRAVRSRGQSVSVPPALSVPPRLGGERPAQ